MKLYRTNIRITRLNDGKYHVIVRIANSEEQYSFDTLDDIEKKIPDLKEDMLQYEAGLDANDTE